MSEPKQGESYNSKKPGQGGYNGQRPRRGPSTRESILRPPVLGEESGLKICMVKGRCYRVPVRDVRKAEEVVGMTMEAADLDMRFEDHTGQYVLQMKEVKPEYYKFIIGSKAATLQQLEKDTGASITIPKTQKEQAEQGIVVRGLNERALVDAKQRIDYIVERSRDKIPYTHFVSIPLDMSSLLPSVEEFINKLKTYCSPESRIHRSVFQLPEKLHLTVLMLRLYSDEDVRKAAATLKACQAGLEKIFRPCDRVRIKGLQCMNDDPTQVNVMYLNVGKDETQQKLLDLIDLVSKEFIVAGLCTSREVEGNKRLHATVMNSKWRKDGDEDAEDDDDDDLRKKRQERVPFDITGILEDYENIDLGEHKLMRMEVSTMTDKGETGYFNSVQTIPFP